MQVDKPLIYREYQALIDDIPLKVAVTLANLWDGSEESVRARASGAQAYGDIVVLDAPEYRAPMRWMFDGEQISIVASATAAVMRAELRAPIGAFILNFVQDLAAEMDAQPDEEPTIH